MTEKILLAWSGGKDSAMALYELKRTQNYQISALITTVTKDYERISMHGVRQHLLTQQAVSIGYPLEQVFISKDTSNEEYEAKMQETLEKYVVAGIHTIAFGDIFLEDLRKYREENLSTIGIKAIFPIWKRNTAELARTFIDLGFKSVISCVDSYVLDKSFAGRFLDKQFLAEIPSNVDPCGENGEYHSFVYDGPIFQNELSFKLGNVVLRDDRFYFCDLIPFNE